MNCCTYKLQNSGLLASPQVLYNIHCLRAPCASKSREGVRDLPDEVPVGWRGEGWAVHGSTLPLLQLVPLLAVALGGVMEQLYKFERSSAKKCT